MKISFFIVFFVLFASSQAAWRLERKDVWMSSGREYVEYRYPETTLWACHKKPLRSNVRPFDYLYSYISGMNSLGMEIPMTAPVTNGYTSNSVTTCFYLPTYVLELCPTTKSATCPKPFTQRYSDRQVVLKRQPPFSILATVWQASSDQIGREQIDRFLNFIATYGKHSNSFHREYFITAGYSSPMSWRQRSELWFVMKSNEVENEEASEDTTTEADNVDVAIVEDNGATIID